MPAPPELRDTAGNVGIVEVLHEVHTEDLAKSDCHITVTGEIKVDVQHECHGIQPIKQHRLIIGCAEYIAELTQSVGNKDLLRKTQSKSPHTCRSLCHAMSAVFQLLFHVHIADNRTCDQLREHGSVSREGDGVLLCRRVTTVDIHRIAHDLEGVEADADGQRHLGNGKRHTSQRFKVFRKEAGILKPAKNRKKGRHRRGQKELRRFGASRPANQQTEHIAHRDHSRHQQHIAGLAPGVEQQTHGEQHGVFQPFRRKEIQCQCAGKKIIQKWDSGKQHIVYLIKKRVRTCPRPFFCV